MRDLRELVTGWSVTGSYDNWVTLAYTGEGVPLWTNRYGPPNSYNEAHAVAVDSSGSVFVTGFSTSNGHADYVTIKYSSSIPPVHLDFQTMNNQLVLIWTNANFGLQSAPAVTETFTNIPSATSPYTNVMTGAQQFFRLISN